ncbi:MAG: TolB family protein [Chitinophagaceae bacterium]
MKLTSLFLAIFLITKTFSQEVKLISTALNTYHNLRDFSISTVTNEAFFTIQSPNQDLSQIVVVKNKKWHQPQLLPFCDGYAYLEPFITYDGKKLFFASNRPKNENDSLKSDFDIWYVERKNLSDNWAKPINAGSLINSKNDEFYPTIASNGNLYFTMDATGGLGKDDIYYSKWDGLMYAKPMLLNKNINSEGYEFNAFISKDEKMLIYTKYNAKGGFGSGDLYIAKKDGNNEWMPAENMGNLINTKFMEYCPYYEQNTNTLYFTSKRSNLAPQKFKNIHQFQSTIIGSHNGLSKLYMVSIRL